MSQPPTPVAPAATSPVDIAREAFRRLAAQRVPPTPQAYAEVYNEVAGLPANTAAARADDGPLGVLTELAERLAHTAGEPSDYGYRMRRSLKDRDWDGYTRLLGALIDSHLRKSSPVERIGQEAADTRALRDMLARTLGFALPGLLSATPELAAEAEALADSAREARSDDELQELAVRLKQLCFQAELHSADRAEQQELLLRLFRLLMENVSELLDEDSWMHGQIAVVQALVAGPMDRRALEDALRGLKDVIYRQGKLKQNLSGVKLTVKNMMMTFIDRLGSMATTTGDYHDRMDGLSQRISKAGNIAELNTVMAEVLTETRAMQSEAQANHERMLNAHREVQEAERRIQELEDELRELSELVREDQLTGTLNRRGLEEAFERECARAERRGNPLCVALLDVDNFKRLNDTYGHSAGDDALRHLVHVVKDTLRSMDVMARLGGEEFLLLLPDTPLESAVNTMTRLQRELTKHFFLHDNEKLLITFSAGVALYQPGESQAALIERADAAMYRAKQAGKNRVMVAE